jgi:site-specific DNA recombinase
MQKSSKRLKALIYSRVSDRKQKTEGDGLESQEHRCRQHAAARGYDVEAVFLDDITGGGDFMKRKGMVALLHYLDEHPETHYVVIFDDLKRFARDTMFHIKLRMEFAGRNVTLECLNFKFGDTPEEEFAETVIAASGQLERKQNARQTKQKMKACLERGYWVFGPPRGYHFIETAERGSFLVRKEPMASAIAEALEGFASGRFETQSEVQRFLQQDSRYPNDPSGGVHMSRVKEMLTCVLYTGYLELSGWKVGLTQAKHAPLISFESYQRIQRRLQGDAKVPARKDINEQFPLRNFILCGDCEKPLRSCFSRGRSDSYGYYLCQTRGCVSYGKSTRREKVEREFEGLLEDLRPTPQLFGIVKQMLRDVWDNLLAASEIATTAVNAELLTIERQKEQLVTRILETDSPSLITAYEGRVKKLEARVIELNEKTRNRDRAPPNFDTELRTAMEFLGNPRKLWDSNRLEDKRAVLKMTFSTKVPYFRNEGFRTVNFSSPIALLRDLRHGKSGMVGPAGLEPATRPL